MLTSSLHTYGAQLTGVPGDFAAYEFIRHAPGDDATSVSLTLTQGGVLDLSGSLGPAGVYLTYSSSELMADLDVTTGSGNDHLNSLVGNITYHAGKGDDRAQVIGGSNTLFGGVGADVLFATDGTNLMSGGADSDYLEVQGGTNTRKAREGLIRR